MNTKKIVMLIVPIIWILMSLIAFFYSKNIKLGIWDLAIGIFCMCILIARNVQSRKLKDSKDTSDSSRE